MTPKVLKDIAASQRTMRRELSFMNNNPKQRKPYYSDMPTSSVIAFSVEDNTLRVVGFK